MFLCGLQFDVLKDLQQISEQKERGQTMSKYEGAYYWVKEEFADRWGLEPNILLTEDEIKRLSLEWDVPVTELKEQLTELF
jgi:hypothetical protein